MEERIFQGLNDQQADAVRAVRGPVCILAGAGSGKTTTITRRIANQIWTGTFGADELLAVTFTEKAAREMGERLRRLGVPAVRARTFHAEALAQYKRFSSDASEIVPSKGQILAPLVSRLPMPHKFTSVRDVATEIEWAKNRCVPPERYAAEVERTGHVPPVPVDLMNGIYSSYERKKARMNLMDFEDLLSRTVDMLTADARALGAIRARYRSFTVDEYQDVNLLQQSLLEAWQGERRDLCVVGDDYQSIFGFTGATPKYLLSFPDRYQDAHIVRLTVNYRSTAQVLNVANRLVPKLGGAPKSLRASTPDVAGAAPDPEPVFRSFGTGRDEVAWIITQCRALRNRGVPWEEMAVLYRINGRSEDLEEAFGADRIPYQVRDGAFLRRPAARAVLARLRRASQAFDGDIAAAVASIVKALGYRAPGDGSDGPDGSDGDNDERDEVTRQSDLGRLMAIAHEFVAAHADATADQFVADLERRFAVDREGRGVQLLTYHRAKGLEFEAVFLPRMEDKELPFALARSDDDIAEERRLLYVGITRAKQNLFVSYAAQRDGERRRSPKPSPFLDEIRPTPPRTAGLMERPRGSAGAAATPVDDAPPRIRVGDDDLALFTALKEWRLRAARTNAIPAYVVFHDTTLAKIAEEKPRNVIELGRISGIGPAKIQRYGSDVLEVVVEHAG